MPSVDDELRSLTALAKFESPENLARVQNFVKPGGACDIKFEDIRLWRNERSGYKLFLQLGLTKDYQGFSTDLYAWFADAEVKIGHVGLSGDDFLPMENSFIDSEVSFAKPFNWLTPGEDSVCLARLRVFVGYLFMVHGQPSSSVNGTRSGELFMDACRVIAQEIDSEERETAGAADSDRSDDAILPDALLLSTGSEASRAATVSSTSQNDVLQPIDQAFATFRAGLVEQLNTAQEYNRHQSATLEAQVIDLETEIEEVKAERQQLNNELVEAKSEAEKWKAQYEGLRKAMLDTMNRHF